MRFLGYDKSGLDAQYNLRAAVQDYQNYFDQWDRRSKQARKILRNRLDVAYGSKPIEVLGIFFTDQANAPVAVFIHGGYWQRLAKSQFSYIAEGFVNAGVTVVVLNYSLAPEVGMDEIVQQSLAALAWIWRHALDHQCNPNRIHVCGHSAGGHLTAVLATTNWLTFGRLMMPSRRVWAWFTSILCSFHPLPSPKIWSLASRRPVGQDWKKTKM